MEKIKTINVNTEKENFKEGFKFGTRMTTIIALCVFAIAMILIFSKDIAEKEMLLKALIK